MNLYNTLLEELNKTIQYKIIRCSLMGGKKNHKQKGKYVWKKITNLLKNYKKTIKTIVNNIKILRPF